MSKTIWTPQPRQEEFMSRNEFEGLYGGAAGGGKSETIVIEALRQVNIPHYKALILRKTYPETRELIDKSLLYYKGAFPKAKYNASEHRWTFPSGAKIYFGQLQHEQDKLKYQGQAYDFVAFDELTHFTFDEYIYLFSRCRPNGPGTECYVRATANPGNIGHQWVKDRFVTAADPGQTIWDDVEIVTPEGRKMTRRLSRVFIPSTVFDNKILMDNDPNYISRLAAMPEAEKKALLYGDWDSFSGQVFSEWKNDSTHYHDRRGTHVITPFEVPQEWSIWCGMDWGYSKPYAVGWFAVDHDKRIYHIRELYGCTGTPDKGVNETPAMVAGRIKEIEESDPNLRGRRIQYIGDPAIWKDEGTQSIGSMFEDAGISFDKANNARWDGLMQLHHRLRMDERGIPMLYVFSNCKNFIRTFPALVYDDKKVEDVDTTQEDHAYDMTRYVLMANPINAPVYAQKKLKPYNPLDDDDIKYDSYEYFRRY